MLGLRKSEAAGFCRQLGLTPLLDHTNDDTRFPRNKLRRDVIPILESINPNVTEAISRLARTARDDFEVIDAVAAEAFSASVTIRDGSVDISKQALRNLPVPVARRVLMAAYESVTGTLDGLESAHIDAMLEVALGRAGASVDLTGGVQMIGDRHVARLAHRVRQDDDCPYPSTVPEQPLSVPGDLDLAGRVQTRCRDTPWRNARAGKRVDSNARPGHPGRRARGQVAQARRPVSSARHARPGQTTGLLRQCRRSPQVA